MTPIRNKAQEVKWWMERFHTLHGRVARPTEMRDMVKRRWPDLDPDIQELIVQVAIGAPANDTRAEAEEDRRDH